MKINDLLKNTMEEEVINCIFGAGSIGRDFAYRFLVDNGVTPHIYCDNNQDLWGSEINGIECVAPSMLINSSKAINCFVCLRWDHVTSVVEQLQGYGIKNIILYSDLLKCDDIRSFFFPDMTDRIAMYSCITNGYDDPPNHSFWPEKCDYYLFTDDISINANRYKVLNVYDYIPEDLKDPILINRYIKINAHKIFPNYRYSIYTDALCSIKKDFTEQISRIPKTGLMVAAKNLHDSIIEEIMRLIVASYDRRETLTKQAMDYYLQGMPDHFGQYFNCVLMREHNNPRCILLMEQWWQELLTYSKRDQVSLPYLIWKNGYEYSDVGIIDEDFDWNNNIGTYWDFLVDHKKKHYKV